MPGEKLVIRLWDTVEKTIGGLLRPWQIRRVGQAKIAVRRIERLDLIQLEQDIKEVQSGRKILTDDGQLVEVSKLPVTSSLHEELDVATLVSTVQSNQVIREMRSEVNVGKALLNAEAELRNDSQEPPDRCVEEDWLFRWRDSASNVSSEELQVLWGRVLAGEVRSPGTFSFRTLEFLKSLSTEEAEWIAKLAPFVVNGDFIYKGRSSPLASLLEPEGWSSLLESEGITLELLLKTCDLGILDTNWKNLKRQLPSEISDAFKCSLVSYGRALVITHKNPNKQAALDAYRLTTLGKQVLKLGAFAPNEPYIRKIGKAIRSQGFKVKLARYQQVTENEGRYFDVEEL